MLFDIVSKKRSIGMVVMELGAALAVIRYNDGYDGQRRGEGEEGETFTRGPGLVGGPRGPQGPNDSKDLECNPRTLFGHLTFLLCHCH